MPKRRMPSRRDPLLDVSPHAPPGRKRAVAYIRVSTLSQAEDGLGLAVQKETIQKYCAQQNLELVHVFEDRGVSGAEEIRKREAWGLLTLSRDAGEFDVVVIMRYDRLARDIYLQEGMVRDLQKHGIELISVMQPESNGHSETRKLVRQIMGVLAEYEKELLVARLRAGREAKARHVGYAGGFVPYGYQTRGQGRDAKIVPMPRDAAVVKLIFERAASGMSYRAIAKGLHDNGILTRRGGKWRGQTVSYIIGNPRYKGMDLDGNLVACPPLVTAILWEQAQHPGQRPMEDKATSTSRAQTAMSDAE